ncbi:MAG: hypothetical protein SF051_14600 [Elusimicrobiota bacterium]|nr:hypothetical protein [Elusimicrobiota bacterium]
MSAPRAHGAFIHPVADALCVGGLLSLAALLLVRDPGAAWYRAAVPFLSLFLNMAHFSASTVRLYGRTGAGESAPAFTYLGPLAALAGVSAAIALAPWCGRAVNALYMTWSPWHYSLQAYGLCVLYAHRAGLPPDAGESRALKAAALFPFALSLMSPVPSNGFLDFIVSPEWAARHLPLYEAYAATRRALSVVAVLLPLALFVRLRAKGRAFPFLIPLVLVSNAAWLAVNQTSFDRWWYLVSAAHGLQYLFVVTTVHAREKSAAEGGVAWPHALRFYGACLLLSYALWRCLPYAYGWLGLGYAESLLLVIAAINLHHFVADAYLWSVRSDQRAAQAVLL